MTVEAAGSTVMEPHRSLGRPSRKIAPHLRRHLLQVNRGQGGLPAARFNAREIQQVVDQALHPSRVGHDGPQKTPGSLLVRAVGQKRFGVS
jgi:hypothetical protein